MPLNTEETYIRTLVENWAEAARSKVMEGVLAHHTDDIVMFDVPMPLQSRGIDEYRKTWELFFSNNPEARGPSRSRNCRSPLAIRWPIATPFSE